MEKSKQSNRLALSNESQELRTTLREFLPLLEAQKDWYGSIYLERKASQSFSVNLKQTQVFDQVSMGVVFRIYNGYTLFEQATDELDRESLKSFVVKFADRVKTTDVPDGAVKRPYSPAKWKDRTASRGLEQEILSQIPANVTSQTPVHFGIRMSQNPSQESPMDWLERLKGIVENCKSEAASQGMKSEDLTFVLARQGCALEESVFLDRETDMSQALYRLSLTVVTMSGADRTIYRTGGLGGLEVAEISQSDLSALIQDLKALKTAERLKPGKYRVLFGPTLTGVLAHEAFGHSQEGDTCARGRSKAWDLHKTGEKVGNEHATILNNPAIYEVGDKPFAAWGSYFFDEEGWLAQEQILLDRGVLRSPMTNLTSAVRLGVPRTANGKRESWANGVYTRQTNTYFSAGDKTYAELMAELKDGYLAVHPAGGMEDPKGMGIQVGISYLEEVRGGTLTGRVFKGPAGGDIQLTGYTPDVLNSIVAKSKIEFDSTKPDRARHPWNDSGGCGKYHKEFVFAGCGGPYLLLDQVILG